MRHVFEPAGVWLFIILGLLWVHAKLGFWQGIAPVLFIALALSIMMEFSPGFQRLKRGEGMFR